MGYPRIRAKARETGARAKRGLQWEGAKGGKMLARCKGVRQQRGASNSAKSRSGERVGESISCQFGSLGGGTPPPSARTAPIHSLGSPPRRGCVPAAGRLLPPRCLLRAERRSFSFSWAPPGPGPMCPLLRGGLGERVRGSYGL